MYSFDYGNSHFVMLNQYFDGQSDRVPKGDLPQATLDWLEADLSATRQPFIWISGHKPIRSLPDMDTGRLRHAESTVSTNKTRFAEFVRILKEHHVRAYICGHTHDCSIAQVHGLWQIDSGHARGAGDTGAPSTFLKVRTAGTRAWVDVHRSDPTGQTYRLRQTLELDAETNQEIGPGR